MSEQNVGMSKTTPKQVVVALVTGLLAPVIGIYLVVQLVVGIQAKHIDKDSTAMSDQAVTERIKPVGELVIVDANAPKVEKTGEAVFNTTCTSCHTSGALSAPKIANKGDWAPRIAQGYETLIKHAIEGIRQMPARGGDPDLSDVEIARAIAFMANQSGAKFTPPEPKVAAAPAAPAAATATPAPPANAANATPAAPSPAPDIATAVTTTATAEKASGKKVYEATCAACHATGVLGAPKAGDQAAWAPRLKTGMDALYKSALHGKNAMPAKGGNVGLTDPAVTAAVDYLAGLAK